LCVHAYGVHACDAHGCKVHACEVQACGVHACGMHACEVHAPRLFICFDVTCYFVKFKPDAVSISCLAINILKL
jgi:hypothetical protein